MVFDVYYAGDGHSIYPSHAYTYPWISRKKKNICRSLIINNFREILLLGKINYAFKDFYSSLFMEAKFTAQLNVFKRFKRTRTRCLS